MRMYGPKHREQVGQKKKEHTYKHTISDLGNSGWLAHGWTHGEQKGNMQTRAERHGS